MEAVVRDTNEDKGGEVHYVFLPPEYEDDSDTPGDEKPTAKRNDTEMGKAIQQLKEPAGNKGNCSKKLGTSAAKKPTESHGKEEETSPKEEVSEVIPIEPARKITKNDSRKVCRQKTAPVYTVEDDSDEQTPEDKDAKIAAQTKSGRSARKRNYTEMKPEAGSKDQQKAGVERKKSPCPGIRKDLSTTIQVETATPKTASLSPGDPPASCPENSSIKSSEATAKRRKEAEDIKQNEKTSRISKTLSPENPSSMESGRSKVIPGNESDSNDIMGEEKGLEYFLGSKVIKPDRKQSSSGRSKISVTPASKTKREIKQKSASDPDVLLLAGKTPTPHPVNSEVLASASVPLKELITKYKSKAGCGLPRIPMEISDKPTLMLFVNKLSKSATVTFEEGKKLLGPSTKYVVEDLASRCIASLMGEITEENCLELKLLALDVNNTEFNRLIDEKIETQLQSPDPRILKSEFLKQLPMDKLVGLISRRNTNLTMECIHKLTNAWLGYEDRDTNMNLFTQIKALELLRCDATFDPTVFDGMSGHIPVFQAGLPGWVFLKSLVTPKKFEKSMESVVSSPFKSPATVKLIEPQGRMPEKVSMTELIGKRKRAMEEAEALPKHPTFPTPSLGTVFKIPKRSRSSSSAGASIANAPSSANYNHIDRSPLKKEGYNASGYQGSEGHSAGDSSGRSGHASRCFEKSGDFRLPKIKSEAPSDDWDSPAASNTDAFPSRRDSCERFVTSGDEVDSWSRPTGVHGNSKRNDFHFDSNSSRPFCKPGLMKAEKNDTIDDWGSSSDSFRNGNAAQCPCSGRGGHRSQNDRNSGNSPSYAGKGETTHNNFNSSTNSKPDWDDWGNGSGRSNTSRPTNMSSSPGFGSSSFNGRENRNFDRETNDFRRGGRGGGRGGRGGGRVPRDDDWACSCGYPSNFGSRNSCYKCQQPRPGGNPDGGSGYRGRDGGRGGRGGGRGSRGNSYDTQRNSGAASWDDFGSASGASATATVTKATDDDDDWDAPPKNTQVNTTSSTGAPSQKTDDWDSPSSANKPANMGAAPYLSSSNVVEDDDWDTPTVKTANNPTGSISRNQEPKESENNVNKLPSPLADTASDAAKISGENEWGDIAGNQENRLSTEKAPGNIPSVASRNASSLASNVEVGKHGNWEEGNGNHGIVSNVDRPVGNHVEKFGERISHSLTDSSRSTGVEISSLNSGPAERDNNWDGVVGSRGEAPADEVKLATSPCIFDASTSCDPRLQRRKSLGEVGASPRDEVSQRSQTPTRKSGGNGVEWTLSPIAGTSNQSIRPVRPENPIRTQPAQIIDAGKCVPSTEEDEWA